MASPERALCVRAYQDPSLSWRADRRGHDRRMALAGMGQRVNRRNLWWSAGATRFMDGTERRAVHPGGLPKSWTRRFGSSRISWHGGTWAEVRWP